MNPSAVSSETIHASCVSIDGRAVLLHGRSGSGKSDLALRLIDRGGLLVSDDYTLLRRAGADLIASPPATIAGRIEVRGVGVVATPHLAEAHVALLVDLDDQAGRMPDEPLPTRRLAGVAIPAIALPALEASSPLKVELALREFGIRRPK